MFNNGSLSNYIKNIKPKKLYKNYIYCDTLTTKNNKAEANFEQLHNFFKSIDSNINLFDMLLSYKKRNCFDTHSHMKQISNYIIDIFIKDLEKITKKKYCAFWINNKLILCFIV